MRSKTKKLLALLSVCCMATAVVGLAGCKDTKDEATETEKIYQLYVAAAEASGNEVLSYEQWLAAIKGADGKDGAPGKDAHEHTYDENAEPVVLIAPTGTGAGLGYVTCNAEDCGHIELKTLDKIAGILAVNPMELTVGEEATVAINTYDENQFGANVLMGEKGVAYFKVNVTGQSLLSITDNVADENVKYTFYSDENFEHASSRFAMAQYDDEDNVIARTVYLKAEYKNVESSSATITVNAKSAEAASVKYNLQIDGDFTSANVQLFNESGEEEPIGGEAYSGFGDDGKAYVMLDATRNWQLKVSVDDGHYVYSDDTINVDFPVDGSKDDGKANSIVTVAKQYVYKFNVKDQNDKAVPYDAVVTALDEDFNMITVNTDYTGTATLCLKETLVDNAFAVGDYTVTVAGAGIIASEALALTPTAATQGVVDGFTLADPENNFEFNVVVDQNVGAWTVDGVENVVEPSAANACGIVNVAEAGEYVVSLIGKGAQQGNFTISVDGKNVATLQGGSTVTITLQKGESKIVIAPALAPSIGAAAVSLAPVPPPTVLTLDENGSATIAPKVQYVYTVTEAGDYTISVPANYSSIDDMLLYASKEAAEQDGFSGEGAIIFGYYYYMDGPVTVSDLEVGDVLTFYMCEWSEAWFDVTDSTTLTIKKAVVVEPEATAVELDTAITLTAGTYYSFTAKKTGTYYFACSKPLAKYNPDTWSYDDWVGLGTTAEWNVDATDNYYNSIQQKYAAIEVVAGETYTFYASKVVGEGKLYIVTRTPDDYVAPNAPDADGDDDMGGMMPKA